MKATHKQSKSISVHKRFTELRRRELNQIIIENFSEEEKNNDLINKREIIKMINSQQIETDLNEIIYSDKFRDELEKKNQVNLLKMSPSNASLRKRTSKLKLDEPQIVNNLSMNVDLNFQGTKYAANESVVDFYKKYHQINEVERKGCLEKPTPSFAFIKSTIKNKLIPNPIGLLKRKGDEKKIDLT